MKNLLLIAAACCLALSASSQSKKPAKVGLSSDFTGKIVSVYQYDYRQNFTIVDSKDGKKGCVQPVSATLPFNLENTSFGVR